MPIFCNYFVTLRCNSQCIFCNIWRDPKLSRSEDLDLNEFIQNLKGLRKIGVRIIDFTGGEPLLNQDLPEILKYAKRNGIFTLLTTNSILYPKRAKEIAGLVDELTFSLDAPTEDEHNQIRGVKCFRKVLESVEIAKNQRQTFSLLYTVTNENIRNLPKMVELAEKNKVFVIINPSFSYFENPSLDAKSCNYIKGFSKHPYIYLDNAYIEFMRRGGNDIDRPTCKALTSTISLSPDDYVYVPCFHHYFKKFKINDNLDALYRSKEFKKYKKMAGKYDFCKNCTIWCYMSTSFLYKINKLFFMTIYSRTRYAITKWMFKRR